MASNYSEGQYSCNSYIKGASMRAAAPQKKPEKITHVLTGEEFTGTEHIALVQAVNPMYVSMRIFGLLLQDKDSTLRGKLCTFNITTIHCILLLLAAWFNALRFFAAYDSSDTYGTPLFRKIFMHLINLQFAFGITSNVYFKHKHIRPFVLRWENYKIKHGGVALKQIKRNILKRLIAINLVVGVTTIVYTIVIMIAEPKVLTEQHFVVMIKMGIERPTWLVILYMIWMTYLTLAWVQSLIFCICINKNLLEEFRELSAEFSREIQAAKRIPRFYEQQSLICHKTKHHTEHYRQRYLELCEVVRRYDDVISSYLLTIYLFTIPAIILLVYALFGLDSDDSQGSVSFFIISMSTLFFNIFVVISVTGSASSIKTAAQKPQRILYSIDLSSCSTEEAISIQVFLHKITMDHVGLTVWKFLNIDKKMLITIFTVVMTYLTILLKFALALGSDTVDESISSEACSCLNVTTPLP